MKRRITLSITLVLSFVLLSLMSSDSTAKAQPEGRRLSFDTGILTLNSPDQVLRVTINWGDGNAPGAVRFRRMGYIEQGNLYRVASQVTTDPITLAPGEGAHIDISQGEFNAVRGVVLGNLIGTDAAGARVTVQIITRSTGRVDSVLCALLIP
jgi:hypothetical protein